MNEVHEKKIEWDENQIKLLNKFESVNKKLF